MSEAGNARQKNLSPAEAGRESATPAELHELVRRAVTGDRVALQALFAALLPVVHKHLSFTLAFAPTVEDAVQESMLRIHRALPGFRGEAQVTTWALTIASRTAHRHARRERRHHDAEQSVRLAASPYGHTDAASGVELALLTRSLSRLKLKKRLAFVLVAILDCSAAEAGEVLGVSPNTAASRYRHAREELLAHMERHDPS